MKKSIMLIAGETSGDQHGAKLVSAMRKKNNMLDFFGIGEESLKNAGMRIIVDSSEICVVGLTEIFSKAGNIVKSLFKIKKEMTKKMPVLLILIDFPEFNLMVAKKAKKLGIPVLYYISPQIWAWRSGRVKKIKRLVDHMAVILPFEKKFYEKEGVPVSYVGNPLLDTNESFMIEEDDDENKTICLLPGSRDGEVKRHLPVMLDASITLAEKYEKIKFVYAMAPGLNKPNILKIIGEYKKKIDLEIIESDIEKALKKSSVAIAGTVTLQAALFCVPMVIIYKISSLSYIFAKALVNVDNIGLVNLTAGKKIVPELIQDEANPKSIAHEVEKLFENKKKRAAIKAELFLVRKSLGKKGASEKVAKIALEMISRDRIS